MDQNTLITLDVGGKCFKTFLGTLLKYPDTLLERMYSQNKFKVDEIQFFDRSSFLFEHILNYYRCGILDKPSLVSNNVWLEEIRYWGLSEPESLFDTDKALNELIELLKPKAPQVSEELTEIENINAKKLADFFTNEINRQY